MRREDLEVGQKTGQGDSGIKLVSLALAGGFFTTGHQRSPRAHCNAPSYTLEHLWILVSAGLLELIPFRYQGMTV